MSLLDLLYYGSAAAVVVYLLYEGIFKYKFESTPYE
jgi:hypothetical protein